MSRSEKAQESSLRRLRVRCSGSGSGSVAFWNDDEVVCMRIAMPFVPLPPAHLILVGAPGQPALVQPPKNSAGVEADAGVGICQHSGVAMRCFPSQCVKQALQSRARIVPHPLPLAWHGDGARIGPLLWVDSRRRRSLWQRGVFGTHECECRVIAWSARPHQTSPISLSTLQRSSQHIVCHERPSVNDFLQLLRFPSRSIDRESL